MAAPKRISKMKRAEDYDWNLDDDENSCSSFSSCISDSEDEYIPPKRQRFGSHSSTDSSDREQHTDTVHPWSADSSNEKEPTDTDTVHPWSADSSNEKEPTDTDTVHPATQDLEDHNGLNGQSERPSASKDNDTILTEGTNSSSNGEQPTDSDIAHPATQDPQVDNGLNGELERPPTSMGNDAIQPESARHEGDQKELATSGFEKDSRLTTKRSRNPAEWMVTKRKVACQAGETYMNQHKKIIPSKAVKAHEHKCKFNCSMLINKDEQISINRSFYELSSNEKKMFILQTTKVGECKRSIYKGKECPSKKSQSFSYFFKLETDEIRVCKFFYLSTLHISQKMIYTTHKNKNKLTLTPKKDGRGKATKEKLTEEKQFVRAHIESFPRVESHYCREKTNKTFLESGLNLSKMYSLYKGTCLEDNSKRKPAKESMYRHIFNTEYNIGFVKPKTDRCDVCEEFRVKKSITTFSETDRQIEEEHLKRKNAMRDDKAMDKVRFQSEPTTALISFDLQNVINCPKVEISSFFYKRKLTVYNLTAHVTVGAMAPKAYCVIWTECHAGRGGNEIASAFFKVLDNVYQNNPSLKKIVTWSDSCVPQNRNSFISSAMMYFLQSNPTLESIEMKYSVPGHSCIQEVDNIHSQLERCFRVAEFHSPLSLIRLILRANRKKPFHVIQLQTSDVKDFQKCGNHLAFNKVPFSKLVTIKFTSNSTMVSYKYGYGETVEYVVVDIRAKAGTRQERANPLPVAIPHPKTVQLKPLTNEKKKDLASMLKFMPLDDKEYMKSLLKL